MRRFGSVIRVKADKLAEYKALHAAADDPKTQEWWKLTDPCQEPIESANKGERWAAMEEVFHI
ncbi:hypothetical protein D3C85_1906870 [compost metagenome]